MACYYIDLQVSSDMVWRYLPLATKRCIMQGRLTIMVLRIWISSSIEQELDNLPRKHPVKCGRNKQRVSAIGGEMLASKEPLSAAQ